MLRVALALGKYPSDVLREISIDEIELINAGLDLIHESQTK